MTDRSRSIIQKFLEEMKLDVTEERVINYIVREVHQGRKLSAVIQDQYVKNRVGEEELGRILENKEIIEAVEKELSQAFEERDFKFAE